MNLNKSLLAAIKQVMIAKKVNSLYNLSVVPSLSIPRKFDINLVLRRKTEGE